MLIPTGCLHRSTDYRLFLERLYRRSVVLLTCMTLISVQLVPVASYAADSPETLLKSAEKLYEQLEYDKALTVLAKLQAHPDATPVFKARAYLYTGVCQTALGKGEDAVAAFSEVLKIQPDFRLPATVSPTIGAMFNEALKQNGMTPGAAPAPGPAAGAPPQAAEPESPPGEVELEVDAPDEVVAGRVIPFTVLLSGDLEDIDRVKIKWRIKPADDPNRDEDDEAEKFSIVSRKFSLKRAKKAAKLLSSSSGKKEENDEHDNDDADVKKDEDDDDQSSESNEDDDEDLDTDFPDGLPFRIEIPAGAFDAEPGTLEYYVDVRDKLSRVIGSSGSKEEPFKMMLKKPSSLKKVVWWTTGVVAGAALVAAGVWGYYKWRSDKEEDESGNGITITIK